MSTRGLAARRTAIAVVAVSAILSLAGPIAGAEPGFAPAQAVPVPSGMSAHSVGSGSVACAAPSSCTAVEGSASGDPFAVSETSGTWGTPQAIALPDGGVAASLGVTCAAVGDCVAAGSLTTGGGESLPLLVESSSGTWGTSTSPSLPVDALTGAFEDATLATPWCASPGNCEVAGAYKATDASWHLMAARETSGSWGDLSALPGEQPGYSGDVALTCTALDTCVVVSDTYALTETAGTWSAPIALDLASDETLFVSGVACPDVATCIAVGTMETFSCPCRPAIDAVALTESSGTWSAPVALERAPSAYQAGLEGIACQSDTCVAVGEGGSYNDNDTYDDPIAATWSAGTWSTMGVEPVVPSGANETDASRLTGVACPTATQCLAVGTAGVYEAGNGPIAQFPFSTSLTPVRPVTAPGTPMDYSASPVIGGADVVWQPPLDDGGAPIASYTATALPGGASCTTSASFGCDIAGLVNGRQYVVTITATNGTATSARVFTNHLFAGAPPSVPADIEVFRTRGAATISWQRSASLPREPVLRYEVDAHGQGIEDHECVTKNRSCTVRGLQKGRSYVVDVTSLDVTGWSLPGQVRFIAK